MWAWKAVVSRSEAICQTRLADEDKSLSLALHGGNSGGNKLKNPGICVGNGKKNETREKI